MICEYGLLEERKLELQKEDDGQYYDFEFPSQTFKNMQFRTGHEVVR